MRGGRSSGETSTPAGARETSRSRNSRAAASLTFHGCVRRATRYGSGMATDAIDDAMLQAMQDNGLSRAEAEAMLAHVTQRWKRAAAVRLEWTRSLRRITRALVLGNAEPLDMFEDMFWIRLFGALTDLRKDFAKVAKVYADEVPKPEAGHAHASESRREWLRSAHRVHEAIEAIRAALTRDELTFVEYARATAAHATQASFRYAVETPAPTKRTLRRRHTLRLLGVALPLDEIYAACDAVVAEHGGTESEVARALATKVSPHVEGLAFVVEAHAVVSGWPRGDARNFSCHT